MISVLLANMGWIQLAVFGVQIVLSLAVWAARKEFVTRTDHDTARKSVAELELRTLAIELTMKQLPNMETINKLSIQLTEVTGQLKVFEERFGNFKDISKRMQQQVDIIDDFLREGNKK